MLYIRYLSREFLTCPFHRSADDQIDHSIANIYGKTIPAKERREFDFIFGHADDVFSQHPEPTREAAIDDILDIADIK